MLCDISENLINRNIYLRFCRFISQSCSPLTASTNSVTAWQCFLLSRFYRQLLTLFCPFAVIRFLYSKTKHRDVIKLIRFAYKFIYTSFNRFKYFAPVFFRYYHSKTLFEPFTAVEFIRKDLLPLCYAVCILGKFYRLLPAQCCRFYNRISSIPARTNPTFYLMPSKFSPFLQMYGGS